MRAKLRFPYNMHAYKVAVARLKHAYPYMVTYKEALGREPEQRVTDEKYKARYWAEINHCDYQWDDGALYFAKKEDATLFKMGMWANIDWATERAQAE